MRSKDRWVVESMTWNALSAAPALSPIWSRSPAAPCAFGPVRASTPLSASTLPNRRARISWSPPAAADASFSAACRPFVRSVVASKDRPRASLISAACSVGFRYCWMTWRSDVVASPAPMPCLVIVAMAAPTWSKPTPAAFANGATLPMVFASWSNVTFPTLTVWNIWSLTLPASEAPSL
jgi:hypothetical protein